MWLSRTSGCSVGTMMEHFALLRSRSNTLNHSLLSQKIQAILYAASYISEEAASLLCQFLLVPICYEKNKQNNTEQYSAIGRVDTLWWMSSNNSKLSLPTSKISDRTLRRMSSNNSKLSLPTSKTPDRTSRSMLNLRNVSEIYCQRLLLLLLNMRKLKSSLHNPNVKTTLQDKSIHWN